ncbi:MAG: hypothetical protein ACRDEA_20610 [Microcystaceae cyanobacterium]
MPKTVVENIVFGQRDAYGGLRLRLIFVLIIHLCAKAKYKS